MMIVHIQEVAIITPYMVKDEKKEFFVFNRRDPDDEWKIKEDEKKNQLIEKRREIFLSLTDFMIIH